MTAQKSLLAGAILGILGVALGAFGAHALKPMLLESGRVETYELAIRYGFYHAFALLLIGIIQQTNTGKIIRWSAISILIGTILFSGSLLLICFINLKPIVFVTPLGGVSLIVGWLFLAIGIVKK
jgi:uncharacterized membrane protein YgdD (TMEM256/DUF423 family)